MESNSLPKRLSPEQEQEYMTRYYKQGDQAARGKLIEHNLRLIVTVITERFLSSSFDFDDLFQVGAQGLVAGIDNFDIAKNFKLSTFLYPYIEGYIRRFITRYNLKMPAEAVISADTQPINEYNDGEETFLIDVLTDDKEELEENTDRMFRKEIMTAIKETLKKEKAKNPKGIATEAFACRYGVYDGVSRTLEEVANILGVSRERVRQMCDRMLRIVKYSLVAKGFAKKRLDGKLDEIY